MKTKIFLIAIGMIFVSHNLSAQEVFPLSGAKWTEHLAHYIVSPVKDIYVSYVLHGDTVIDDIKRSKLWYIPDITKKDSSLKGFIHLQGDTVFYRQRDELCIPNDLDYPLYDFSLLKGDTGTNRCNYPYNGDFQVLDVDSIELGGAVRKRVTTDTYGDQDYWIEGMGSLFGLFYGLEFIPTGSPTKNFVCFTHNNELIYLNPRYSQCPDSAYAAAASISPKAKSYVINISPNPAKSTAVIQSDTPLQKIQIYNLNAVLLHEQSCNGEYEVVMQKMPQHQGLYLVKIILQNGDVQIEKLSIE